ncbi:MAG: hypothetical protein ABGY71_08855 [bacterium]|jgi:hypothetical protein|nr:hypothetical protein [Planctomycetota bacterium]HIL53207.1 hypothetical protein [Planctomycetota bacterium]
MITAAILASLSLASPAPAAAPLAPVPAVLEVHYSNTHLQLRSLTGEPLLVIFSSASSGLETVFWLSPGGQYDEEFPRGTLFGLDLEVVQDSQLGWITSGAIAFDPKSFGVTDSLWVQPCGHSVMQSGSGGPAFGLAPGQSHLPAELGVLGPDEAHATSGGGHAEPAFHVPALTPTNKPKGDHPPRLRKKPLPPV